MGVGEAEGTDGTEGTEGEREEKEEGRKKCILRCIIIKRNRTLKKEKGGR